MKEIQELTERMDGTDELIDSLIKKITDLEKKEIKVTDYSLHFEAIQKIFEVFLVRYNKECDDLNTAFGKLNSEYPAEQIQQCLAEIKIILTAIQKSLPVKVKHQFDFNTKGWIIAGMMLLLVTAIISGLCVHFWVDNNRLVGNDIKFRAIRQVYPNLAKWADEYYSKNPNAMEAATVKLENEALEKSTEIDSMPKKQKGNNSNKRSKKRD
ncbi:prefoldin subunit 5 [Mucilaginibacter sp. UYNi724]